MKKHSLLKKFMNVALGLTMVGAWALSTTGVKAAGTAEIPAEVTDHYPSKNFFWGQPGEELIKSTMSVTSNSSLNESNIYVITNPSDSFEITGIYSTTTIKNNDNLITASRYPAVEYGDVFSKFEATLTIPKGLVFDIANSPALQEGLYVEGSNNKFKIGQVYTTSATDSTTLHVPMYYVNNRISDDAHTITGQQFTDDILNVGDAFISRALVKFDQNARPGTVYSLSGTVDGLLYFVKPEGRFISGKFRQNWYASDVVNERDLSDLSLRTPSVTKVMYSAPVSPARATLPVINKVITNGTEANRADHFRFKVDKSANAPTPSGVHTDGTIDLFGATAMALGEVEFTSAGTYTYTISEIDDRLEGYTYDDKVYTIKYDVALNEAGTELVATPSTTEPFTFTNTVAVKPQPSNNPVTPDDNPLMPGDKPTTPTNTTVTKPSKTPNTGIHNGVMGYGLLAMMAMVGFCVAYKFKKEAK